MLFRCGQLLAIAYNDSSVMNVLPIFRCCKPVALAISLATPWSVTPVIPNREMDVSFAAHFVSEILYSPSSVIWQPQQIFEMSSSRRAYARRTTRAVESSSIFSPAKLSLSLRPSDSFTARFHFLHTPLALAKSAKDGIMKKT